MLSSNFPQTNELLSNDRREISPYANLPPRGKDASSIGAAEAVTGAILFVAAAIAAIVFAVTRVKVCDALFVAASVHRRQPSLDASTVVLVRTVHAVRTTIANLSS